MLLKINMVHPFWQETSIFQDITFVRLMIFKLFSIGHNTEEELAIVILVD